MAKEKAVEEKTVDAAKAINDQANATQEAKAEQEAQQVDAAFEKQAESIVPVTETVAKVDAQSEAALENAAKPETASGVMDLATLANRTDWRVDEHGRRNHPNDVKFQMKDGTIHVVSTESAELLKNAGEGNIVA